MKPFAIIEAEQRSAEWFKARAGRLTGSVASAITAFNKDKSESAKRRDLRTRLVLETLTGVPLDDDGYQNADMRRGIELEPEAIEAFEAASGLLVQKTGFLAHNDLKIGCSLDGHFGDFAGILEMKCPRSANHLDYIRNGGLPAEHRMQVTHNLFVTGAAFAEFVSYDPRFPEPLRLFRVRVERDEAAMTSYQLLVTQFLRECAEEYAEVSRLAMRAA